MINPNDRSAILNFATLTFVGPGEVEARRLTNLLASLNQYEPRVSCVIIIDDNTGRDLADCAPCRLRSILRIVPNPRHGRGHWWSGGLCTGLVEGLRIASGDNFDFVVRLDTDALVINPFQDRISTYFTQHPNIGLLGSWLKSPVSGQQRLPHPASDASVRHMVNKAARLLTLWRHDQRAWRLQSPLKRSDRVVRRLVRRAISNGYPPGYYIQGGGYAVNGCLLKSLGNSGRLDAPLQFLDQWFGEDVLATLLCYAEGFEPRDFNQCGEVFAVQNNGIPASIEDLVSLNFGVVHSIKNDEKCSEDEILSHALPNF